MREKKSVASRLAVCLAAALGALPAEGRTSSPASRAPIPGAAARVPVFFVPNQGQFSPEVLFEVSGPSGVVAFTRRGFRSASRTARAAGPPAPRRAVSLDASGRGGGAGLRIESLRFEGASADPRVTGAGPLPATIHYFRGADPSAWRTGLPAYSEIVYRGLYPGIDLRVEGVEGEIRSTFVVSAGADVSQIRWTRRGGAISLREPRRFSAWQDAAGGSRAVEVRGTLREDGSRSLAFPAGFDRSSPLLVDARILDSTYLGGGSDDIAYAVAADSSGKAYVTGSTLSTDFPAVDALDSGCGTDGACDGGTTDAFVVKLDPSLPGASSLVWATYLGGSRDDVGVSIAAEDGGSVLVAGIARADFPTTAGAFQTSFGSAAGVGADGFLARLDADGAALLYSTYVGGSNGDGAWGLAADGAGGAWIVGQTFSADFPSTAGVADDSCGSDSACDGDKSDAFLARFDTTKSGAASLVFATFLGGTGDDQAFGVARGASGAIAVAGRTLSTDFPTAGPFQSMPGGGYDAFVSLFDAAGANLTYSTYFGGAGYDDGYGLALDGDGDGGVLVTGTTGSGDLPSTASAFQRFFGGTYDAWVARLDPAAGGAESLRYASYLGGSGDDEGFGLALDAKGVDLAGFSASFDFPAPTCPLQPGNGGGYDAFLARVAPSVAGSASLLFASPLGGGGTDAAYGVALGPEGRLFLAGQTGSADFPAVNAADDTLGGASDAFLTEVSIALPAPASITPTSGPASGGSAVTVAGERFALSAGLSVGGAPASGVSVAGPTQLSASTPALEPGTLNDVRIENPDTCGGILPKAWLADFQDVPASHLFHAAVEKIFRAGITSGCGSGRFCPDDGVTRDQMAIFLLRGEHGGAYRPPAATGAVFGDVSADAFAASWIERIAAEKITTGCGSGNYCPASLVNRATMAVMLLRAKHGGSYFPPDAVGLFSDVPASDPFARWIERLSQEGITSGCGGGHFCPDRATTRGEMAAFLSRTFGAP